MDIMIKGYVNAEQYKAMAKLGYKFYVEGDWKVLDTKDPWSGMPNVEGTTHFFTDRAEAEAYAITQAWVFNPNVHGRVKVIKEG